MLTLLLPKRRPLKVLCIGAHSDDLEIGCGGTVLRLIQEVPSIEITWVVLSAVESRAEEARASAHDFTRAAWRVTVMLNQFQDGYFPAQYRELKNVFEQIKRKTDPDLIFTHRQADRHQDHRLASELTWNTWRDHMVLEYEIPKYESDLGQPNMYVPLANRLVQRKVKLLQRHFATQRSKSWFSDSTFLGLLRLRGVECRAPSGFAEAFHGNKLVIAPDAARRS